LLGKRDGAYDFLDDDPFIDLAAPAAGLDDLAHQPVAGQAGAVVGAGPMTADSQLHQLAGPHSGQRRRRDDACMASGPNQAVRTNGRHGQRPRDHLARVRAGNRVRVAAPHILDTDAGDSVLQHRANLLEEDWGDVPVSCRPQQMNEVDLQQRICRVPAAGFAQGDLAWIEPGQRAVCLQVSVDEGCEAVLIGQAPDKLGVFGLLVGSAQAPQVSDMGTEFIDHVQARGQQRSEDVVAQRRGFDHDLWPGGRPGDHPRGRLAPRPEPGAVAGCGQQFAVVGDLLHGRYDRPQRAAGLGPDDLARPIADHTVVAQECIAMILGDGRQRRDVPLVQPIQPEGAGMPRDAAGPRQRQHP
jgi:hypothetical protein